MGRLLWMIGLSAAFSCSTAPEATAPDANPDTTNAPLRDASVTIDDTAALARAGTVVLDFEGVRAAVEEARVLQIWNTGHHAQMAALKDPVLRRRIIADGLDTRLSRAEFHRRKLAIPPARLMQELANAAMGQKFGTKGPKTIWDPDPLNARLAARYDASASAVRQVVVDLLTLDILSESMLNGVKKTTLEAQWRAEQTQLTVDLIRVPRVPSTRELDRAVVSRKAAIAARYKKDLGKFERSARVLAHRILIKRGSSAGRPALVKALDALKKGADFETLAAKIGEGAERRNGGRMGAISIKISKAAFALKAVGDLSPIEETKRGWAIYRLDGRLAPFKRPLEDRSVQREIAATILRERDLLPRARGHAEDARLLLQSAPDGLELKALVKSARLSRGPTKPFSIAGPQVIPAVGIDVPFFDGVLALTPEKRVTGIYHVRQSYVMARLLSRDAPAADAWPPVAATFTASWRRRQKGRIVQKWIDRHLKGKSRWIDMPKVMALSLDALDSRKPISALP